MGEIWNSRSVAMMTICIKWCGGEERERQEEGQAISSLFLFEVLSKTEREARHANWSFRLVRKLLVFQLRIRLGSRKRDPLDVV